MASRNVKVTRMLHSIIEVKTIQGRTFVGRFMAFDKYMNIVLSDCEERRTIFDKKTNEERSIKRTVGLMMLRGDCVLRYTVIKSANVCYFYIDSIN